MNYVHVFLAGAAIIILATLVSLRRTHIRVEYSVSWLLVGCALFLCSFFPKLLFRVAANLGLNPPTCFVLLAGALALMLLFEVSFVVSRLRDENVVLTQKVAILEYHLGQIQARHGRESE